MHYLRYYSASTDTDTFYISIVFDISFSNNSLGLINYSFVRRKKPVNLVHYDFDSLQCAKMIQFLTKKVVIFNRKCSNNLKSWLILRNIHLYDEKRSVTSVQQSSECRNDSDGDCAYFSVQDLVVVISLKTMSNETRFLNWKTVNLIRLVISLVFK